MDQIDEDIDKMQAIIEGKCRDCGDSGVLTIKEYSNDRTCYWYISKPCQCKYGGGGLDERGRTMYRHRHR